MWFLQLTDVRLFDDEDLEPIDDNTLKGIDLVGRSVLIGGRGEVAMFDKTIAMLVDRQGRVTVSGVEAAPVEERHRNMRAAARMRADLNGRPLPIEMDAIRPLFGFVDLVRV
jgi:hypothetical protein